MQGRDSRCVCGKIQPGEGRVAACVMANKSTALKRCVEAINNDRPRRAWCGNVAASEISGMARIFGENLRDFGDCAGLQSYE
jgi:hypothetical protein